MLQISSSEISKSLLFYRENATLWSVIMKTHTVASVAVAGNVHYIQFNLLVPHILAVLALISSVYCY